MTPVNIFILLKLILRSVIYHTLLKTPKLKTLQSLGYPLNNFIKKLLELYSHPLSHLASRSCYSHSSSLYFCSICCTPAILMHLYLNYLTVFSHIDFGHSGSKEILLYTLLIGKNIINILIKTFHKVEKH